MNEPDNDTDLRQQDYTTRLRDAQQDLPPEFQKVLDDHWLELLTDD
jgi:hypothetical protein